MNKQKKLIDSKNIFLFGAGVIAIFTLLFHKAEQLKAMFEVVQPDRISMAYLQLLVDMDPSDNGSRLALAHQYVAVGKADEASAVLKPFLNSQGQEAAEGKLLNLEIDLNAYFSKPALDPTKEKELSELQAKVASIANQSIPKTLIAKVIEKSLALGKPELAALLFERLAKLDQTKSFQHRQDAGRWYIAAGKPMLAAEMYHNAFRSTNDAKIAKQYALLAINATRAADKGKTGLDYLKDFRSRFPNDEDLVNEAIALSLATNNPNQAFELGQARLAQYSTNPEHLNKQIELALAVGKLDVALALSEKLLVVKPLDFDIHRRTAQIAEWSGQPNIAFKHWGYLIGAGDLEAKTQENFYRLANSLKNPDPIIQAFSGVSNKRLLADTELNLILDSANKKNDANKLALFLRSYLKQHPTHKDAWITYVRTQEKAEKITAALETLKHISTAFNRDTKLSVLEASLLNKIGQPEKAYQHLLLAKKLATSEDIEYWQAFADLSWEQKHSASAIEAYKLIWQSKAADVVVAERLIQLLRDNKQPKDGIAIAKTAYQKFNEPRWLLLGMDTASQFKSWQDLRDLLRTANPNAQKFNKMEMYWLLRAQLSSHDQQPNLALSEYQEVLKINPNSKIAKDGIMWNLVGQLGKVNSRIHSASNSFRAMINSTSMRW